ncbi:MAG: fibronectin type III domain-containing protein [Planctomycetes bacterium]|nr:fibronectin type III domain-containing protein [Planctomycetota bacterium]
MNSRPCGGFWVVAGLIALAATEPAKAQAGGLQAPTNLVATPQAWNQVSLSWMDNAKKETEYRVQRRPVGGQFAQIATLPANSTSYVDLGVTASTAYEWRVLAANNSGQTSQPSNVAEATTAAYPSPTGVTAVATAWNAVQVSWIDTTSDEAEFRVEVRSPAGVGEFSAAGNTAANLTTFQHGGLLGETSYEYRVVARHASGVESPPSAGSTVTTPAYPAPAGIGAQATAWNRVLLTWTNTSSDESGFRVERRGGGVTEFVGVADLPANASSHLDEALAEATSYEYRVRALLAGQPMTPSEVVHVTTPVYPTPTNVSAQAFAWNQVFLSWTNTSWDESSFQIERYSAELEQWLAVGWAPSGASSYLDQGLQGGFDYQYRVRAVYATQPMTPSEVVSVTTPVYPAPANVTVWASSWSQAFVSWTNTSWDESGFQIERYSAELEQWLAVGWVPSGASNYLDQGLQGGTEYQYRVRALYFSQPMTPSSVVAIVTPAVPAPSGLSAFLLADDRIGLTWSDPSHEETSFVIERREPPGEFFFLTSVPANTTFYEDTWLPPGTTYEYRVLAEYAGGVRSAPSNVASAATGGQGPGSLAPPTDVAGRAISPGVVRLTWTASSQTDHVIQRSPAGEGTFADVGWASPGVPWGLDQSAAADTEYDYRVLAWDWNTNTGSAPSDAVTVRTPAEPVIETIAGDGIAGFAGDGGPASLARFDQPWGVAIGPDEAVLVVDSNNLRLRRFVVDGLIDSLATLPAQSYPAGVAVSPAGEVHVALPGQSVIVRIDAQSGAAVVVAGTGAYGFNGDGLAATETQLDRPQGLAFDATGNLLIADTENHRIRRVDAVTGVVTTVAGTGAYGFSGDGGPATGAALARPADLAVGPAGDLFVVDLDNRRVRRMSAATGVITTFAGNGGWGVAVDADGTVYVSDGSWHVVYRIDVEGIVSRLTGTPGWPEYQGDGGPSRQARVSSPQGLAIDAEGRLVLVDRTNFRVRRITGIRW